MLRFRLAKFERRGNDATGQHRHQVNEVGEAGRLETVVKAIPDSRRTPIRLRLVAHDVMGESMQTHRLEWDFYLAADDANRLARQLYEVLGTMDTRDP